MESLKRIAKYEAYRQVRKAITSGASNSKKRAPQRNIQTFQFDGLEDTDNPLTDPQGRAVVLQALRQMDPYEFEHLVADVWAEKGWTTEVSTASNDAGVDVTAVREFPYTQKILIQAKRYGEDTTVGSPEVQQYASLRQHENDIDAAVIVTTSSFTQAGKDMADRLNVKCIDGQALLDVIRGAQAESVLTNYLPGLEPLFEEDETASIENQDNPTSDSVRRRRIV
jgi:restriction system protein